MGACQRISHRADRFGCFCNFPCRSLPVISFSFSILWPTPSLLGALLVRRLCCRRVYDDRYLFRSLLRAGLHRRLRHLPCPALRRARRKRPALERGGVVAAVGRLCRYHNRALLRLLTRYFSGCAHRRISMPRHTAICSLFSSAPGATVFYNIISNMLRSLGDSRTRCFS